jgi:hypothetical protein
VSAAAAHPASYPAGTTELFLTDKADGDETHDLPADFKKLHCFTSIPPMFSRCNDLAQGKLHSTIYFHVTI